MIKKKIFLILLFALCVFSSNAAEKNIIAVFDFKGAFNRSFKQGTQFSLLLFSELNASDNIKMVERQQIDKVMKEKKLTRSGLIGHKYMQIARIINADYIVTGRIYTDEDEDEIKVNLKLIKCEDGKIFGKIFFVPLTKKDEYLERIAKKAAKFIVKSFAKKNDRQNTVVR